MRYKTAIKINPLIAVRKSCLLLLSALIISFAYIQNAEAAAKAKTPPSRPIVASAPGAILPDYRIVGYYGNFLSTRMGVLGEYPPDEMLRMLRSEVRKWSAADPETPVMPAIEYIAVVAQKDAGKDGKYRARMADSEIRKAIYLADQVDGIVILDVQVGLSNLESELPRLEKFLKLPNVMLAIDPEFSMPNGSLPGQRIGTVDAREINYAINYLAHLVDKYNLPPKLLVVHRFTQRMVTNHKNIRPLPEVQVVMDMDGWGTRARKKDSYHAYITKEPVQYTGIKLFYKHDRKDPSSGLLSPEQILEMNPIPMFILYQ